VISGQADGTKSQEATSGVLTKKSTLI